MRASVNRRQFLKGAAGAGLGFWVANHYARGAEGTSPSDKLNVAIVGVTGRGGDNIKEMEEEAHELFNIVALCDVYDPFLESVGLRYPKAKRYDDYRQMLDKQKDIDAVLCATADHAHAWVTLAALRSGRHVYCEKPLAHSLEEVRLVTQTAQQQRRVTQMGTQIHATNNYRRVVEVVQSGAIGDVSEVHVFIEKAWYQDKPVRTGVPIPKGLDWEMWQCAQPEREYSPDYLPASWRRFWQYGEGTLGDMGCHLIDLPTWALGLTAPTKISAEGPPVHPDWCPKAVKVNYEFPARDGKPAVKLTWYDGGNKPDLVKELNLAKHKLSHMAIIFVGSKGTLAADYDKYVLFPEEKFGDFKPPAPSIPPSPGHHKEWILACMKSDVTGPLCNFSYSGPLTETVLLGTVAYRTGKELAWDPAKLAAANVPEADQFIQLKYREGWKLM
ncbi:MAG TPA: Gfo/Idh/MocA family oxidoreductase [Tepidisphaeraceae bacterium]|jgi:predicted dehydrogenase